MASRQSLMKHEELSKLLQNKHVALSCLGTTTITLDSKFYSSVAVELQRKLGLV
jgi:hypothetical protein